MVKSAIKQYTPKRLYCALSRWRRKAGNTLLQARMKPSGLFSVGPMYPILVNSIPKSGSNLLLNMIAAIPGTWYANEMYLAAEKHFPEDRLAFVQESISDISPGAIYAGHIPYSRNIAQWVEMQGIKQIFIYRDPRDVTVSAYHYVMNTQPRHPYYATYAKMESDAERLMAFIQGVGEGRTQYRWSVTSMPNIRLMYEIFMDWLSTPNTLAVRFEDIIDDANSDNKAVLIVRRILEFLEMPYSDRLITDILRIGRNPKSSPTFRKGVVGSWREEYTEQHIQAFNETAPGLLKQLGYRWEDYSENNE